jgi:hypothetical protein
MDEDSRSIDPVSNSSRSSTSPIFNLSRLSTFQYTVSLITPLGFWKLFDRRAVRKRAWMLHLHSRSIDPVSNSSRSSTSPIFNLSRLLQMPFVEGRPDLPIYRLLNHSSWLLEIVRSSCGTEESLDVTSTQVGVVVPSGDVVVV